jgi:cbb3-type cytochrome oxidase maturation protein
MEALYLLIPLSIAVVFGAIWIFFRMSDSGQFDDMVGPALRILQDDDSGVVSAPAPSAAAQQDPDVATQRKPH